MLRAGEAAAAEADRGHVEVPPVLLDEQVGGGLRGAEQRVGRQVDRHRRVDAPVIAVVLRQLQPGRQVLQRQPVGRVAVDLVGRAEDERRVRAMRPGRLEQVQGAVRVDAEVGLRLARRPVVRRLRGGVHDDLDRGCVLGEQALHALGIPDVELVRAELGVGPPQLLGDGCGRRVRAEECAAHVVLDPDDVEALRHQVAHGLRADQTAGAGDYRDRWHGQRKADRQAPVRGALMLVAARITKQR